MASPETASDLGALVVGLGSIGVRHLENLRRLGCGRLGAFRSRQRALHKAVDLDDVAMHYDFGEALDGGYDLVVVANPTALHMEYARRAAEAGCSLYIDKPLSHTLEDTDDLLRVVNEKALVVTVGCQLRFHPNLMAVKGWLEAGLVGRPLGVQVDTGEYLPEWHPWEDYREGYAAREDLGGGVALTLIHEIDLLYWLLGPLQVVNAFGGRSGALELDVEDHLTATLLSREDVPVSLHMDYLQRPPCRRMKIVGSRGSIEWDYYTGLASVTVDGAVREESRVPESWDRNDLFLGIMSDFLDSVRAGRASRVPLEDGIETLRIALALKAGMGRSPVTG